MNLWPDISREVPLDESTAPPAAPPASAPFSSGGPPPPPPSAEPGWAGAAMLIHGVQQIPRPILISLAPAGYPAIAIDLRHHVFVSALHAHELPALPESVAVGTYPIETDSPGLAGERQGLDPLLWAIGLNAFGTARAPWLREGDKYRLRRWPDLDVLPSTAEQLHVLRTTVKSLMTVDKLARVARVEPGIAQQVINALSLMNALRRLEGKGGAPAVPMPTADYDLPDRPRGRHVKRGG